MVIFIFWVDFDLSLAFVRRFTVKRVGVSTGECLSFFFLLPFFFRSCSLLYFFFRLCFAHSTVGSGFLFALTCFL